jgi:ABC-2 type transport system permease protein
MTQGIGQDARWAAVQAGLARGWIETRETYSSVGRVIGNLIFPLVYAGVLLIMGDNTVPGTRFALGAMVLPGIVGMSIAFGGLTGPAATIAVDREDGTLLRAKATPNGMLGYLIGKLVMFALTTLVGLALLVIPGALVANDLVFGARTWLMLGLVFVLGMGATVPLSVALGSLVKTSAQSSFVVLVSMLLVIPSGIFYPITALPQWLQWVGQMFPFYWLGLGARAALLPAPMMVAEIGQSWRVSVMVMVLIAWCIAGMLIAPRFLRSVARHQSGSVVARARERFLSKGY